MKNGRAGGAGRRPASGDWVMSDLGTDSGSEFKSQVSMTQARRRTATFKFTEANSG